MTATTEPTEEALWQSWFDAAARPDIEAEIVALYRSLDAGVASRGPTCWSSGKCCKFDAYGHRLYVTGLEIARVVLHASEHTSVDATDLSLHPSDGCVFQVDGLCSVHPIRPLGCRIFFCQQGTQDWQQELYERYQNQLIELHKQFELPYRYMEWRTGLRSACSYPN